MNKITCDMCKDLLPLVKDGRAIAQIVVPELADVAETFAAEELQKWVGAMTGAYIPVEKPSAAKKDVATVYVGEGFAELLRKSHLAIVIFLFAFVGLRRFYPCSLHTLRDADLRSVFIVAHPDVSEMKVGGPRFVKMYAY